MGCFCGFPTPVGLKAGWSYFVTGGTNIVDGIEFKTDDRLIAIADGASGTVYAANWYKADYTDQVLSVNGDIGTVSISDANLVTTDIATNNATALKHGFLPKTSNDPAQFLIGQAK